MHGDEPAPPQALLKLLRRGVFDDRAEWYLVPLLNPTGFVAGTRENAEGIDLNRDYRHPRSAEILSHTRWLAKQTRFDITFCLHEDYEATGFYLYEVSAGDLPSLANVMLAAAAAEGLIEQATLIDGREAAGPGLIRPAIDPILNEAWSEAIFLREHHTHLSYREVLKSPAGSALRAKRQAARRGGGGILGEAIPASPTPRMSEWLSTRRATGKHGWAGVGCAGTYLSGMPPPHPPWPSRISRSRRPRRKF